MLPVAHVPLHPVHVLPEHVRVLQAVAVFQPQPVLGSTNPMDPQKAALVVLPVEQRVALVAAEQMSPEVCTHAEPIEMPIA